MDLKEKAKKVQEMLNSLKDLNSIGKDGIEFISEFNEAVEKRQKSVQEALEEIADKIESLEITFEQVKAHPRLSSWGPTAVPPVPAASQTEVKIVKTRNAHNPKKGLLLFLIKPEKSAGAGFKIYKDLKVENIKQENLSKKLLSIITVNGDLNKNLMKYVHSKEAESYLETNEGQKFLYNLVTKLKSIRKSMQSVDSDKSA